MIEQFAALWQPVLFVVDALSMTAFIWAPILLFYALWDLWHGWKQAEYVKKTFVPKLLEIRLPKEIMKSPFAMEQVFDPMYQGSTGTWYDKLWKGRVLPEFSLEMISTEGNVRFFIRTPEKFRIPIEAAIYAQYPDVEIVEEPRDYVYDVPYTKSSKEWSLWGTEFKLGKEDAYPIKTYVDFKLNEVQAKEEQKVDPLSSIIELLGSTGRNAHMWIQIMIQPATERHAIKSGSFWETNFKKQDWKGQGKELIKKIQASAGETGVSKQDQEKISAIQRSMAKRGFDTGIRAVYVAREGSFVGALCGGIYGMFRPFASLEYNEIKGTRTTDFDYPWQDYKDIRVNGLKWKMFDAYIRRSYFMPPYKRKPFVLNTEELATIFHFPGDVSQTPTFGRIESKKGEPPTNLPV